jgi:hypothetical protein
MCAKKIVHQNSVGRVVKSACGQVHVDIGVMTVRFDQNSFRLLRSLINVSSSILAHQEYNEDGHKKRSANEETEFAFEHVLVMKSGQA